MNRNPLLLAIATFVFFPQCVMADMITPLSLYTIPLIPFIILIEACVLWVFAPAGDQALPVHRAIHSSGVPLPV